MQKLVLNGKLEKSMVHSTKRAYQNMNEELLHREGDIAISKRRRYKRRNSVVRSMIFSEISQIQDFPKTNDTKKKIDSIDVLVDAVLAADTKIKKQNKS